MHKYISIAINTENCLKNSCHFFLLANAGPKTYIHIDFQYLF